LSSSASSTGFDVGYFFRAELVSFLIVTAAIPDCRDALTMREVAADRPDWFPLSSIAEAKAALSRA
jgi:hypothetical protein